MAVSFLKRIVPKYVAKDSSEYLSKTENLCVTFCLKICYVTLSRIICINFIHNSDYFNAI